MRTPPKGRLALARVIAASALLVAASCAWLHRLPGGLFWATDVIANLAAQIALASGVLGAWWLASRKPRAGVVCALAVLPALAAVTRSTPRHWTLDERTSPALRVRVLIANTLAQNENRTVAEAILSQDADILCLHESPWWLMEELKQGGRWRDAYPYYWVSDHAGPGFLVLLSKWPQHDPVSLREGARFAATTGARAAVIARPEGSFALAMPSALSPRTPERWRTGNERLRELAARMERHAGSRGLPVVVAADLNATPTGARTTMLHERLGLVRAKPLRRFSGSYGMIWPFTVAIDDAAVPVGTRVTGWRTVDLPGSDHDAVLIEIELAPPEHDPLGARVNARDAPTRGDQDP